MDLPVLIWARKPVPALLSNGTKDGLNALLCCAVEVKMARRTARTPFFAELIRAKLTFPPGLADLPVLIGCPHV